MKNINYEITHRIYRLKTINSFKKKALLLGNSNTDDIINFLLGRLLISLILFISLFITENIYVAVITVFIFYVGASYLIFDYRIKLREKVLEKEALYFFEVLELSLKSGKNMIESLKLTTDSIDSELSTEFKKTLKEIEYGKSFHDSLTDLRNRIPSDSIQNVILNIMEAYTTGGNITKTINNQVLFIRNKRIMDIKAHINQIPIKVSIVSVFLFIPLVLLLILTPVILEYFVG